MIIASGITHPHGAASAVGSGTHWFAIGLLIGFLVAAVAPGFVKAVVIICDVVALGWSYGILNFVDHAHGPWVLSGVAFLLIGMAWGVVRGLRHLGDAEYFARLGNIRKLGRWF